MLARKETHHALQFHDAHFHLTNYIQEGPSLSHFST